MNSLIQFPGIQPMSLLLKISHKFLRFVLLQVRKRPGLEAIFQEEQLYMEDLYYATWILSLYYSL